MRWLTLKDEPIDDLHEFVRTSAHVGRDLHQFVRASAHDGRHGTRREPCAG